MTLYNNLNIRKGPSARKKLTRETSSDYWVVLFQPNSLKWAKTVSCITVLSNSILLVWWTQCWELIFLETHDLRENSKVFVKPGGKDFPWKIIGLFFLALRLCLFQYWLGWSPTLFISCIINRPSKKSYR